MSEPSAEELARLRETFKDTPRDYLPAWPVPALLDEVDRLTEALEDVQGLVREWEQIRCGVLSPGLRKAAADVRLRGVGDAIKAANDEMKRQDYADWLNRAERAEANLAELADLREAMEHIKALPEGHTDEWSPREHLGHHVMFAVTYQALQKAEADLADEKRRHADGLAEAWERGHEVCEWPRCVERHVNPYRALLSDTTTGRVMAAKPLCPECRDGKHLNCAGWALDPVTDAEVDCDCAGCAVLFEAQGRTETATVRENRRGVGSGSTEDAKGRQRGAER